MANTGGGEMTMAVGEPYRWTCSHWPNGTPDEMSGCSRCQQQTATYTFPDWPKPRKAKVGWECPVCGGGNNPEVSRCPCIPRRMGGAGEEQRQEGGLTTTVGGSTNSGNVAGSNYPVI